MAEDEIGAKYQDIKLVKIDQINKKRLIGKNRPKNEIGQNWKINEIGQIAQ